MKQFTEIFNELSQIDVNQYIETITSNDGKTKLSYLSWAFAFKTISSRYNWEYEIIKDENGKLYFYDEKLGYLVRTKVTIEGNTREMWLPVLNGNNKTLRDYAYEYGGKYGKRTVEQASMFDINKTIMRCLVKNLALFGLGLYIYAGEDLPISEETKEVEETEAKEELPFDDVKPELDEKLLKDCESLNITIVKIANVFGKKEDEITNEDLIKAITMQKEAKKRLRK